MFYKSLLVSQFEKFVDLQQTQALNVDGPPLLVGLVIVVRVDCLHLIVLLEIEYLYI